MMATSANGTSPATEPMTFDQVLLLETRKWFKFGGGTKKSAKMLSMGVSGAGGGDN